MAAPDQIKEIAAAFHTLRPVPFLKEVNEASVGIGAVMAFLEEASGDVTAGSIAEAMGVSTARVAVLLKKMEARGLIVKESAPADARITIVRMTDEGRQLAVRMKEEIYRKVGRIIDNIGMDRLREFFAVAGEIDRLTQEAE